MAQPIHGEDDLRWLEATRLVAGELDEPVASPVRAWLLSTAEGQAVLEQARIAWAETAPLAALPGISWDTEQAMQRFRVARSVAGVQDGSRARVAGAPPARKTVRVRFAGSVAPLGNRSWGLAAAATLAVALIGGAAWRRQATVSRTDMASVSAVALSAAPGAAPRTVTLFDGSRVTLAPGSTLRSARGYGAEHRLLELDGDAMFTVKAGPHAFQVRTRDVLVEDVSTSFVVRGREDGVQVVVVDGAVVVGVRRDTLRVGTGGMVAHRGLIAPLDRAAMRSATVWPQGMLVFADEPLREVARRLSRWTGQTLRVDTVLEERPVTVTFDGELPHVMFDVLATTVGASLDSTPSGWRLRSNSP
jgi:ferric-dicitrate binding protein FerR (iron transport regulator)